MLQHATRTLGLTLAALTVGACSRNVAVESAGDVELPAATIPATAASLPAGSTLEVELTEPIGTGISQVGDSFTARVTNTVTAQNDAVVVPAGATITGEITGLSSSGNAGEPAAVRLDFRTLRIGDESYPFQASVTKTANVRPETDNRETVERAVAGAAVGAVLGAVIGDVNLKSILIGGALGAGAGAIISLGTDDVQARLPEGTKMTLRVSETVALR